MGYCTAYLYSPFWPHPLILPVGRRMAQQCKTKLHHYHINFGSLLIIFEELYYQDFQKAWAVFR
jgi:hypothetical protein